MVRDRVTARVTHHNCLDTRRAHLTVPQLRVTEVVRLVPRAIECTRACAAVVGESQRAASH